MKRLTDVVGRYNRKLLDRGMSPERQEEATLHYEMGVQGLREFTIGMEQNLSPMGLPLYVHHAALNFAKQIYGFARRYPKDMLVTLAARAAVPWLACGLTVDQLIKVARDSLTNLNFGVQAEETDKMREMMQYETATAKADKGKEETGKERVVEADEVRSQNAEGGAQSDETREARSESAEVTTGEQAVTLKPSELAAKVQEFLATKLTNPGDAEPIAKDIAEAVVQGLKPTPAPARHKPMRHARPAPSELSAASVTGQSTPLERFTKRGATDALRAALTGHQDIVKLVVAGRLCAKRTFDELAQEYGLTKDEVLDIITRMRGWVSRFTTYFDNDWYWKDGMGKYFIRDLPKTVNQLTAEGQK